MVDHPIALAQPVVAIEPACSFCTRPSRYCRVLLHNHDYSAFICEGCAPVAAAMTLDIVKKQDERVGGEH